MHCTARGVRCRGDRDNQRPGIAPSLNGLPYLPFTRLLSPVPADSGLGRKLLADSFAIYARVLEAIYNRNRDINIDRDIDVDVDHHGGWYDDHDHWHPVATGLAVGAAAAVGAAVIGSIVNSVPADCDTLVVNGTSYRHCNGTWYEPRYSGGDVTYIVVESPQ